MGWLRYLVLAAAVLTAGTALADDPPLPRPRPPAGLQIPAASALPSSPEARLAKPQTAEPAMPAPAPLPSGTDVIAPAAVAPAASVTAADAARALAAIPQPVALAATLTDGGTPLMGGLTWRIFDAKPDANGKLALVAKSEKAEPLLKLPPGNYVVHVAYGEAETSDELEVTKGEVKKSLVLDAGGLRLNAAITGDVKIPPSLVHFEVSIGGPSDADRTLVANNVSPNQVLTLNSGTYHVVSNFGSTNAEVKADLRVEAGKLTDATLYHRAAQISFKLVSNPGGEAIADVDWTVKTSDGSTIFTDTGAFPATVLAEGDYLVLAKRGASVYNRQFQVQPGAPQEIEVLTAVTQPKPAG